MDAWLSNDAFWKVYIPAATVIGGFATGLGILIGGISILLIWFQTRRSERVSKEITAFDAHKDYIRLCIESPHLSSSAMMKEHLKLGSFSGILDMNTVETERALWFISYVLFAMEQLLLTSRRRFKVDAAWLRTVEDQLFYHAELLGEVWSDWADHYSDEMGVVVQGVLERGLPQLPPQTLAD